MLFNSFEFILGFLPLTWLGYQLVHRTYPGQASTAFLAIASVIFYAYWDYHYIWLILGSTTGNFFLARRIVLTHTKAYKLRLTLVMLGISANIALLGYYKYTNFLIGNLEQLTGLEFAVSHVILPIGISFFTFKQIAFVVDCYRGDAVELDFTKYLLFVTFFPDLIAGPILHHQELMPHVGRQRPSDLSIDLAVGMSIFVVGLGKKVLLADAVGAEASIVFDAAARGTPITLVDAWSGALCYTLQIYFDFSAYSDMAVGLGRMFGVQIPMNFASPYKATSIIDFWRRWHITLSRFLRDYLYVPLGGNRCGRARRQLNIFITMLLGGIWHGAGWTFVLWGALHGLFIVINHLWREFLSRQPRVLKLGSAWFCAPLTFLCVVLAWVPFRAPDLDTTWQVYRGMLGLNGISLPSAAASIIGEMPNLADDLAITASGILVHTKTVSVLVPLLLVAVWVLPNTMEIFRIAQPTVPTRGYPATDLTRVSVGMVRWRPGLGQAALIGILLLLCLGLLHGPSEFIYFQF